MHLQLCLLITSGTNLPVAFLIIGKQIRQLMSGLLYVPTGITGTQATLREDMLTMLDATLTVSTARPVIYGIVVPFFADSVFGSSLLAAGAAYLLVLGFIYIREIAVFVFAGGLDSFFGFGAAISTDQLS